MKSDLTYSAKDLAGILSITDRAVQKRAEKEKWSFDQVDNPRGGGRRKLYRLSSMPKAIRDSVAEYQLRNALERKAQASPDPLALVPVNGRAVHANANGTVSSLPASAPIIPDKAREIGLAKYRLVREWREVVSQQPWSKRGAATEAFLLAYGSGRLLPDVYRKIGEISDKTLYRLDKQLRDCGDDYYAISDGRGGWRRHGTNKWRPRTISREAQEEFLRCYLRPERPSVTLSMHAARMILANQGVAEESSDATWRRWLKDFEKHHQHVLVLAREGEKAYRDKIGTYITRDDSLLEVGQVLVADGHDLNFNILHPQTGKPVRMKLILFFDWASRMPVGWQIMPTENSIAIQAALRNAILTLGKIPQCVYLDNGKAFKSRVFTETNPDLRDLAGLYARLGIATAFAMPYNARAKVIERYFLTLTAQFERLMPTYCGSSIADKPAWMARNEKMHRAWHMARTQGWVPNVREAAHMLSLFFQWYGNQPHEGLNGRKPLEVLDAGRGPGVDPHDLNAQFLWLKKVRPSRCRITLYTVEYESDCLHGLSGDVIVRYDTSDLSVVHCYTTDGAYLGDARPVQALHPLARLFGDQVGVDQVKSELERQRRLARQTRQNLLQLGASTADVDGLKSLPWNRKAAVLPGGKGDALPGVADDKAEAEERTRLELVYRRDVENAPVEPQKPKLERPEHFRSEAARYDWCFRAKHQHGEELSGEDAAFMTYFEATGEYRENYRQRYSDLAELYALHGESAKN